MSQMIKRFKDNIESYITLAVMASGFVTLQNKINEVEKNSQSVKALQIEKTEIRERLIRIETLIEVDIKNREKELKDKMK